MILLYSKRVSGFDMAPPSTTTCLVRLPLQFGALPMMPVQAMTQHYQATRHARRVYVGGLPPNANEQVLYSHWFCLA
nr:splicing factor U2af large subunit A isoform X1 [Ipomoea batatas]GMD04265.1 splicing factor U2af large subunit A isoform X1 [Ipomoea batatas]GMD19247.1 splicing factor U2af large subunit A isoform X1 [Ipomoea batatas]